MNNRDMTLNQLTRFFILGLIIGISIMMFINSVAGDDCIIIPSTSNGITAINFDVSRTITPLDCFNIGDDCIINLLCQSTNCTITNNSIIIEWRW